MNIFISVWCDPFTVIQKCRNMRFYLNIQENVILTLLLVTYKLITEIKVSIYSVSITETENQPNLDYNNTFPITITQTEFY